MTGVFLGALALALAGLFLPSPFGAALLLALAAALAALLARTWPHHDTRARALRIAILVLLVTLAVARY